MASKKGHVDGPADTVSKEILSFMKKHPSLEYDNEKKKIRCQLTGHELPCQLGALKSYTDGKKYKRLSSQEAFDFKRYEPHIVQSNKKSHEHQLFCRLTLRHLNRIPSHVARHINGRRYKKALEKYEECQRQGVKFVPAARQRRAAPLDMEGDEKRFSTNPEDSGEESDAESVDSLSDLYPAGEFDVEMDKEEEEEAGGQEDSEKEDEDMENMDVEETNASGDARPTRRKHKGPNQGHAPNKKFKKGNPSKWKGKQETEQHEQNNSKPNQSKAGKKHGKGKKKKKPRIM